MSRRVIGLLARQLSGGKNHTRAAAGELVAGTRDLGQKEEDQNTNLRQGWEAHWDSATKVATDAATSRPKTHPDGTENKAGTCVRLPGRLSVQETYAPNGAGFGWNPQGRVGLQMKSFRIPGGLEAQWKGSRDFESVPGVLADGVVSCLLDTQGNWAAALALMDQHGLRAPPLMSCQAFAVQFRGVQPTPASQMLFVRAEHQEPWSERGTTIVPVTMTLSTMGTGPYDDNEEVVLATGEANYIKIGAMMDIRSMVF